MKYSGIGGQAVMEGVMMRNGKSYAVAVRKPDHEIEVMVKEDSASLFDEKWNKVPLVRGVLSFIDSLVLGMSTLMYSATFFEDEEEEETEPSRREKRKAAREEKEQAGAGGRAEAKKTETAGDPSPPLRAAETGEKMEGARPEDTPSPDAQKDKAREAGESGGEKSAVKKSDQKEESDPKEKAFMGAVAAFSIVLAVAIFMILPYYLSQLFQRFVTDNTNVVAVFEGILRLVIFILYILLISRMEDIQRVFMYHGAEHKCINCVEHGLDLTVENVRKSSREHKRCGTSFLVFVIVITVILYMFIRVESHAMRLIIRLLLIPVIAGISYELLRAAGRTENPVIQVLSKPGLWMQKLTVKEPDDEMIEVGIASVEAVFDWRTFVEEVRAEESGAQAGNTGECCK